MLKSGFRRPERDAKGLGNRLERQVEVVVEHHHGSVVDGESAESSLELIAVGDRPELLVRSGRLVSRHDPEIRAPAPNSMTLGVAGANEEPVRPRLKAGGVAKLWQISPDGQQRLLRRVLGQIRVAQDPVRHCMEAVTDGDGEAREGLLVSSLRAGHQLEVHVAPTGGAGFAPTLSARYGRQAAPNGAIFGGDETKWRDGAGGGAAG